MKEFQLTLRNEKKKQYILIALLFVLINGLAFSYLGLTTTSTFPQLSFFLQAGAILACILIDYFFKNENKRFLLVGMILSGLAWLMNENWWAFGLCLIVCFLFASTNRLLIIKLNPGLIIYPSFPKRKIKWDNLNNVILKDGILTIDLKSNKLIQQHLDENAGPVNEREFNEFCRQQLITKRPGVPGNLGGSEGLSELFNIVDGAD